MELYSGSRSKRDIKKEEELIADLRIQVVLKSISERAYEQMKKFRSSHRVEINDMPITATAIETEAKMISKNQKHYQFLPGYVFALLISLQLYYWTNSIHLCS